MPQISPMNWIIIVSTFLLAMALVSSHLPKYKTEAQLPPKMKMLKKSFSW